MKKLIFLSWFIPFIGFSQTKVVYTMRVFPKATNASDFEKALKLHVTKYHNHSGKWTVYKIQTEPDSDGYMIFEEAVTWKIIDSLIKTQIEPLTDWNKNVAIYLTERANNSYYVFRDSLSTAAVSDTASVIILNHQYPKGGASANVIDMIKRERKVWLNVNESRTLYQVANSRAPQFVVITLLKKGLTALGEDFGNMVQRFNALNGAGAWDIFNQDFAKYVESRWNEIYFIVRT